MYQFTTTTIVNSNLDSDGVTSKFVGSADALFVSRTGRFYNANIVSLHKRPYAAGVKEIAEVTVPVITAKKVIRATVNIQLDKNANSEFANSSTFFSKPITVEVLATGVAATDAAAIVKQLNDLKTRFGHSYVTAAADGAKVVVTCKDVYQRVKSIVIESEVLNPTQTITPEYDNVGTGFAVTTAGKIGFGDDNWMARAIVLPTAENVRYFGLSKEERPVLGGNYTQYTLRYKVEKPEQDGIVANGYSITTHVFYVLNSLVTAFETELDKLTNKPYTVVVTAGDASLANEATTQLTVTNAVGPVTWSVKSGTSATVNAAGLVTAHAVTDGDTVIEATDSVGNVGEITITVA